MSDTIVSIRMPKSLANELKRLADSEHFLDVSEEVRSIVRQKWNFHQNPGLFEIKKLRESIETDVREKTQKKIQQEVARELEKIRDQLRKGFENE